jgi:hypothetical protein
VYFTGEAVLKGSPAFPFPLLADVGETYQRLPEIAQKIGGTKTTSSFHHSYHTIIPSVISRLDGAYRSA